MKYLKDNTELVSEQPPDVRGNFSDYGLTQQKLELVRKGMWKVVNEEGGTARGARIQGVEVAGKTGTAQAWLPDGQKDNHTLFICFAPYVHPQYAVCILVEGGKSGGGCAAPVAKRILEQALNLDKGYEVTLAPVKEVIGNFNHIEQVSFEGVAPVALNPNEQDNDTGNGGDEPPKPKPAPEKKRIINANVRAKADEEGSRAVKKDQPPPQRRPGFFQRLFGH
jgi:penicillin-binding protein 2